ncbi:MAG TPA: hypothetical protein VLE74_04160 [Candidatus Saccharimonadales bacterium]|nr:hypothetical protein [Candidatus Saccharimonadales bacterium]
MTALETLETNVAASAEPRIIIPTFEDVDARVRRIQEAGTVVDAGMFDWMGSDATLGIIQSYDKPLNLMGACLLEKVGEQVLVTRINKPKVRIKPYSDKYRDFARCEGTLPEPIVIDEPLVLRGLCRFTQKYNEWQRFLTCPIVSVTYL